MLERFLEYLVAERRYSPLTVRNYRRDIDRFLEWRRGRNEPCDPAQIDTDAIREWIIRRTDVDKVSAASMNREISSLRAWFRWLLRTGEVGRDIFRGIRSLRTSRRLPVFVPDTRMSEIVTDCRAEQESFEEERNALIVLMFYGCGLRLAELIAADRDDFAADCRSLKVRGKGDKERIVPVVEGLRRKILHYLDTLRRQNICISGEKALFLTHEGRRISRSTVYRIVKRELASEGVQGKKSPHVLRHTFATQLLNDGADMREIQELLGHASLQATQVYTHNSIARLQEIYHRAHPREQADAETGKKPTSDGFRTEY